MKPLFVILGLTLLVSAPRLRAQDAAQGEEGEDRVKYALILPEEKTPELVKPEENNPFEMMADPGAQREGSTEENQVRDLLLGMAVGGASQGPSGIRVMLGGMRLQEGMEVPAVIPDQQVSLRVKAITPSAIELVWVEKKPTGLPPKLLVIPMDGSPKVRYRMPAGAGGAPGSGGSLGTIRRSEVSAFSRHTDEPEAPRTSQVGSPFTTPASPSPAPTQAPPPPPAAAPAPNSSEEASVLRMLFGNRPPEAK